MKRRSRCATLAVIAFVPLISCAPLTQPGIREGGFEEGGGSIPLPPPSALETYLEFREGATTDRDGVFRPWIAVLPFYDDSGFREGVWDIENEMPRMFTQEMHGSRAWHMVPYEAVEELKLKSEQLWHEEMLTEVSKVLMADQVLIGTLLDYNMERLHVGDPLVGGYKSFKGTAEIEVRLVRADQETVGTFHAQKEVTDRGVGLDLLGRPRDQDYQFVNLNRMAYGSEDFRATAIGSATAQIMDVLIQQMSQALRPSGLRMVAGAPEVLSVFGDEIFINVGSENGVHRGYRFAVFPGVRAEQENLDTTVKVAVIEVQDIIGARVSKVKSVLGSGIEVGDRLELILVPQGEGGPLNGEGGEGQ